MRTILLIFFVALGSWRAYAQKVGDEVKLYGKVYQLNKLLGQGGFGQAFSAQTADGEVTVIKFIDITKYKSIESSLELLRNPAYEKAAHLLRYSLPEQQLIFGKNLLIQSVPLVEPLPTKLPETPDRFRRLFQMMQEGLAGIGEMHRLGFVHRDIKPDNMGTLDGRVVLYDFDISAKEIPSSNKIAGTVRFMPPEMMSEGQATVATDVFALGVSMIQLLFGPEAIVSKFAAGQQRTPAMEFYNRSVDFAKRELFERNYLEPFVQRFDALEAATKDQVRLDELKVLRRMVFEALAWDPGTRLEGLALNEAAPESFRRAIQDKVAPIVQARKRDLCSMMQRASTLGSVGETVVYRHP